jgi:MFS family permease
MGAGLFAAMNLPDPFATPVSLRGRLANGLHVYAGKLHLFRPNARLYLLSVIITGVSFGIFRLLFNFYVLSLGYDEALLGRLLTVTSLVALAGALPAGYFSDRLGRKVSLLLAAFIGSAALAGLVIWPSVTGFYLMVGLAGIAQSLSGVTFGPFLVENSGEEERTYLFSFSFGIQMVAGFGGNWLGGRLPAWMGEAFGTAATSSSAYGWAILIVAGASFLAVIPLALLHRQKTARQKGQSSLSPFEYARRHPATLFKLVTPLLITSLGAGLLMPFMNIFYRSAYGQSDAAVGSLFALGSLAMAIGLLVAPPLADRWGKMRVVVITQAISIPFLVAMGFAPWYWLSAGAYLVRLALMNMSNPVYQTFVMEQVDENSRATVASLVSMSWSFGWAFSPTLSGWLQVRYGFTPVYLGTITTYVVAIFLYWLFFLKKQPAAGHQPVSFTGS